MSQLYDYVETCLQCRKWNQMIPYIDTKPFIILNEQLKPNYGVLDHMTMFEGY